MTLVDKFIKEFEELPVEKQAEVIDFMEFLRFKEDRKMNDLMDSIITDNNEALLELAK